MKKEIDNKEQNEGKNKKTKVLVCLISVLAILLLGLYVVFTLSSKGIIGKIGASKIEKEFYKHFNSKERTIIYYASPTCGYCKLETPILETLSKDYDMDYYYLDATKLSRSESKKILEELDAPSSGTPMTFIVENGKTIDVQNGYVPANEYIEFFVKNKLLPKDAVYSKEANITFINFDEYSELIDSDDKNVFVIGQTTCSHCIAIKPALNSVAKKYDLTINYLNLTDMTDSEKEGFYSSLTELNYDDPDYLESGSIGTPLVYLVEDGEITEYFSGERSTSQLISEFKKWNLIEE